MSEICEIVGDDLLGAAASRNVSVKGVIDQATLHAALA